MIDPSDDEYMLAKLIKKNEAELAAEFVPLADWIELTFGVRPLNILYLPIETLQKKPRLDVAFEFSKDCQLFLDQTKIYSAPAKERAVIEKFKSLYSGTYETHDLFVTFSAFESIACCEANESIREEDIETLQNRVASPDLWKIVRRFQYTNFMVYSNEQIEKVRQSDIHKIWSNAYFDVLKNYDEFGYFQRDRFLVNLDSKENFDNNYNGRWDWYFR